MEDFEQWSEKRKEIVTPENYSSLEAVRETADNLDDLCGPITPPTGVNPLMYEPFLLEKVLKGETDFSHYLRSGNESLTQLQKRILALEVGRLSHPEYFDCLTFSDGMRAISATLRALVYDPDGVFIHGKVMYPSTIENLRDNGTGRNRIGSRPSPGDGHGIISTPSAS